MSPEPFAHDGSSTSRRARLMRLDVLRGIAILIVIMHHSVVDAAHAGNLAWVAAPLERIGFSGVDLFFVLSGFLIGGLLFDEMLGGPSLRVPLIRFYLRRALKIWPAYFVFLGYALLKQHRHLGSWAAAVHDLRPNFLHAQNYLGTSFWHTWSLAVEEHFYLALPVALAFACVVGPPTVGVIVTCGTLAALIGCGLGRFHLNHDLEFRTHLRCDGLLLGVFIAYVSRFHPARLHPLAQRRGVWLIAGLALVAPNLALDVHSTYTRRIGYSLLALGYACILIAVLLAPPGSGLLADLLHGRVGRLLAGVGTYSYCIYLFHGDLLRMPISFHVVPRLAACPPTVAFVAATSLYVLASIALGALLTHLIEWPALALRERLIPRSTARPPARPAGHASSQNAFPEVHRALR